MAQARKPVQTGPASPPHRLPRSQPSNLIQRMSAQIGRIKVAASNPNPHSPFPSSLPAGSAKRHGTPLGPATNAIACWEVAKRECCAHAAPRCVPSGAPARKQRLGTMGSAPSFPHLLLFSSTAGPSLLSSHRHTAGLPMQGCNGVTLCYDRAGIEGGFRKAFSFE